MESLDWREVFCGRRRELDGLMRLYREVAAGSGPRIAVVLGDRGMGKTRLVQEFYRLLASHEDPQDYWPVTGLFTANNLRVAPDMSVPAVRDHYASFKIEDRPMPYLWWGFRIPDPHVRNSISGDLASYRGTLDPHLAPIFYARRVAAAQKKLLKLGAELGRSALLKAVQMIPALNIAASALELYSQYCEGSDKSRELVEAVRNYRGGRPQSAAAARDAQSNDIRQDTLRDLEELLAPAKDLARIPVIVFCDDAQFMGANGDGEALELLSSLWEKAHLGNWPLLLVLTHWETDWQRDQDTKATCARVFRASAESATYGATFSLGKEAALAGIVQAAQPALNAADVYLLLDKADGNPQVLVELVDLLRRSAAWRKPDGSSLTELGRRGLRNASTSLRDLILQRLESEQTSQAVRHVVALASVQGMEFLCTLTAAAATAMGLDQPQRALDDARTEHRLFVDLEDGLAEFVQRAYREAASALVERHIGEPAEVQRELLRCAIRLLAAEDSCSLKEWRAMVAYVADVGPELGSPDQWPAIGTHILEAYAPLSDHNVRGHAARRAEQYARRFLSGLGKQWDFFVAKRYSNVFVHMLQDVRASSGMQHIADILRDALAHARAHNWLESGLLYLAADLAREEGRLDDEASLSEEARKLVYIAFPERAALMELRLQALRAAQAGQRELGTRLTRQAMAMAQQKLSEMREHEQMLIDAGCEMGAPTVQERSSLAFEHALHGRLLLKLGHFAEARDLLDQAAVIYRELRPSLLREWNQLPPEDQGEFYTELHSLWPHHAKTLAMLGTAHLALGDRASAEFCFLEVVNLDANYKHERDAAPHLMRVQSKLAALREAAADPVSALAHHKQAVEYAQRCAVLRPDREHRERCANITLAAAAFAEALPDKDLSSHWRAEGERLRAAE